ncbi:MAG: hypothetical protein AUI14_18875 [Actinobacteria bacterium 13_2_20CM_2_71_6]|nr:MAG: hypothetical protein AUI14_18875 [Actinobacteria bacterium 13_2_20CM_2_71_6]
MADRSPYRTAAAFRTAVDTKLRALSRQDGRRPFNELRREFLYQRFLARVFARQDSPWVLKGGVGLLTRFPGARHSRDIDLVHLVADSVVAGAELREIGRLDLGGHLRFEVARSMPLSVPDALKLKMVAYAGVARWENFDIDVSCERHFVAGLDLVQPRPVLDVDGVPELPTFRLYPLVDQIADKVSAMCEMHGHDVPSNRYRDLVDLVLLVDIDELDAALLSAALWPRARHARNEVTMPTAMRAPGAGWLDGYPAEARRSSLPTKLHDLAEALAYAGRCLNPVLDGSVRTGLWNPADRAWVRVRT